MLQSIKYKIVDLLLPENRRPENYERCPECDRRMLYRDIFEHYFTQHFEVPVIKEKQREQSKVYEREMASRGDLVDDYEIHWDTDQSEKGVRLPDLEEKENQKLNHLRTYYHRVKEQIDANGKAVITCNTHIGSARGYHVVQNFRMAVRRIDDDSLENYEIVGEEPWEIKKV